MNSFDNETCLNNFVEYISKRYLSGKTEDKILTTSMTVTDFLLDKGYYDVWTLDLFKEYKEAKERGISPQFARGMIFNNEIFIPISEENKRELSDGIDIKPSFPTIEEFNHIVVANELVVDNDLAMAQVKKRDLIVGFCLNDADIRIASYMYSYNKALGNQYKLDTQHINGYQYTLIKKK